MRQAVIRGVGAALVALAAAGAAAQSTDVAFGGLRHDSTLPVEVTAERLTIDQTDGTAVFSGNVVVGQGEMRLAAAEVRVRYATAGGGDATGRIQELIATGGVTLVSGAEAAEAREAVYTVATGVIVLTGEVVLTQGRNALSGDRLTVDLNAGTGVMEGRVRTVFQPAAGGAP
jgi:lipopolysaccharide export system protein LptA